MIPDQRGNLLSGSHVAHFYTFRDGLIADAKVYYSIDEAKC